MTRKFYGCILTRLDYTRCAGQLFLPVYVASLKSRYLAMMSGIFPRNFFNNHAMVNICSFSGSPNTRNVWCLEDLIYIEL